MPRPHGTGQLYIKYGSYYLRWRAADGRRFNRRIGKMRARGTTDGLTRTQAEHGARKLVQAEELCPPRQAIEEPRHTVSEVADALRERLLTEGARLSYRQNCESMQRIHIAPVLAGDESTR